MRLTRISQNTKDKKKDIHYTDFTFKTKYKKSPYYSSYNEVGVHFRFKFKINIFQKNRTVTADSL